MSIGGWTAELNPEAILAALGVGDARVNSVLGGGLGDTALWRVDRPGGAAVLRVFAAGKARPCQREVVAMQAARAGGVPTPQVLASGTWQGHPALLLSWCHGRDLISAVRAQPWRMWALGYRFGLSQAAIHRVRAPVELTPLARHWTDWVSPEDVALRERLEALSPRSDALLHLDYHPFNVTVSQGRIACVFDWVNVSSGDPRADVARTWALLAVAPVPEGTNHAGMTLWRRIFVPAWQRGYRRAAGRRDNMEVFSAWAATTMVLDLAPKVGRAGSWITQQNIDHLRETANEWRARAGIAPIP